MEFLYKPEIGRYTDILNGIDSVKDFTNLLNITTSYNQIVSELESAKNILNYHIFGNEELSPLTLHERLKNINSYYINDTIKMFKVINRDKTLKDFYNTLKTTTMEELHNKYQLVYQAITNAKIEQEYQEVVSQLNVQEYDNGEFSITIPKTTQDIINEGKALHHCVGVYVDKVVRREDMIYFLRKDREVPYITIEVNMIGKNVVFVPYPSTHYTITVKNDDEDIEVEVSEQEYNDIKVNDTITIEKIEKYRSSEYVNTTYRLKN